jgi:hypothetical protein|tara:strand:+ start:494 stop:724 length:231 start_codon:yes stop_codon:yes gene_type:complete
MTKRNLITELAEVETGIKLLQKKREALREEAIMKGWAMWKITISQRAPSLAWWKEHRPSTWQKHVKSTEVKRFEIV